MADIEPVTRFYGRWASLYDLVARYTPGIGSIRTELADELHLETGDTVVEMGCGTGANLPHLRDRVGPDGRVVGVDVTPGVLRYALRRSRASGWTNVHLVRGDAARPPIDEADAILATFVVGMLDDPAAAVQEWCDHVSPGGRIGLLDATRTTHPLLRPANALFRAFVTLTAPPGTRLRYTEPPADVLGRRVAASRSAVADRCGQLTETSRGMGFLNLAVGTIA